MTIEQPMLRRDQERMAVINIV